MAKKELKVKKTERKGEVVDAEAAKKTYKCQNTTQILCG